MKLFQKTSVAVALTVVMIAAAIGIGQVRGSSAPAVPQAAGLDKSLSTSSYATWISDEAEVLSDQEEQQICLYNANWVARYDSLIAVATVREVSGAILPTTPMHWESRSSWERRTASWWWIPGPTTAIWQWGPTIP